MFTEVDKSDEELKAGKVAGPDTPQQAAGYLTTSPRDSGNQSGHNDKYTTDLDHTFGFDFTARAFQNLPREKDHRTSNENTEGNPH